MSIIIQIIEQSDSGSLVVTSETIAEGTGVEHRAVLQTLTKYAEDFESFGKLAFEMRPGYNNSQIRTALLNEQQASLLMTYQRNTERVRRFKIALVDAFYKMAQQLTTSTRALSFEEKMLEVMGTLQAKVTAQHEQLAIAAPKAASFDTFLNAAGDYDVRDAAQLLHREHGIDIGRTRLFAWLRENKWIDRSGRPYQNRVDRGLIRLKASTFKFARTNGEEQLAKPQVRITAKGLHALRIELGGGTAALEVVA